MRLSVDLNENQEKKLQQIKEQLQTPSKAETVRRLIIEKEIKDARI
ncbi:MAG: hypothetical protein UR84_C0022G0008 [candidate division WS6 bacterium GW2011_GWD1_35_594]|nr:MAG: hypothetical protein UR43_C0027G0004 [candidate division TM6 bacterium GW2011_GWF2_33_332]KKP81561.1 MAG: hypothetical protein UR84_C0022G0008 [candidate division WS6 bacterium GW2011_GWD1_35_594]